MNVTGLTILIILLIIANLLLGYRNLKHRSKNTPILNCVKDIALIYDLINGIVEKTGVDKVSIWKLPYDVDIPYMDVVYETSNDGSEKLVVKRGEILLEDSIIDKLKPLDIGEEVSIITDELFYGEKKHILTLDKIKWSKMRKIAESDTAMYFVGLHFFEFDKHMNKGEKVITTRTINKIISIFEKHRDDL